MGSPLDLNNVQADILSGLPKKTETFFFFEIANDRVDDFREQLAGLVPVVTTVAQVEDDKNKIVEHKRQRMALKYATPKFLTMSGVNLAFSKKGLEKMGIHDEIGDSAFNAGMLADAEHLGDQGTSSSGKFDPDWIPKFKEEIHGVILVTGDCHTSVKAKLAEIKDIFSVGEEDASIHQVLEVVGDVRPGELSAHEHFGFLDSISQPAVQGVDTNLHPGQEPAVRQGIILLGREGDATQRPPWALDGSFLAFRYLSQNVPEFDTFLKKNAIPIPDDPNLPKDLGSELLGARLVGRWKSGAPIDITPIRDDPDLGRDPSRNNNFKYDPSSQERCPFAAHTRKTFPRADLPAAADEAHRVIRHGIQFGPEVSAEEAALNKTTKDRGLFFVSYQSSIENGFRFLQHDWANNINFPPKSPVVPGFDPIIGQTTNLAPRVLSGTNPSDQNATLSLSEQWVVTRGGEYFFSPSIPALKETFALKETKEAELS